MKEKSDNDSPMTKGMPRGLNFAVLCVLLNGLLLWGLYSSIHKTFSPPRSHPTKHQVTMEPIKHSEAYKNFFCEDCRFSCEACEPFKVFEDCDSCDALRSYKPYDPSPGCEENRNSVEWVAKQIEALVRSGRYDRFYRYTLGRPPFISHSWSFDSPFFIRNAPFSGWHRFGFVTVVALHGVLIVFCIVWLWKFASSPNLSILRRCSSASATVAGLFLILFSAETLFFEGHHLSDKRDVVLLSPKPEVLRHIGAQLPYKGEFPVDWENEFYSFNLENEGPYFLTLPDLNPKEISWLSNIYVSPSKHGMEILEMGPMESGDRLLRSNGLYNLLHAGFFTDNPKATFIVKNLHWLLLSLSPLALLGVLTGTRDTCQWGWWLVHSHGAVLISDNYRSDYVYALDVAQEKLFLEPSGWPHAKYCMVIFRSVFHFGALSFLSLLSVHERQ